jgi:hypothetical protein
VKEWRSCITAKEHLRRANWIKQNEMSIDYIQSINSIYFKNKIYLKINFKKNNK